MTRFFSSHRGAPRCIALAFCLAGAGHAVAQTSVPPLFVTASRTEQPLTDLLADVTLIGPEEIAGAGPGGLTALLQRQPGIEIVTNGGPGSASGVFMRGAPRWDEKKRVIDMLRVRRASPHGKWIESTRRASFGRKEASSFRPDIASPRCAKIRKCDRRSSVRRPVSGLVSSGPRLDCRSQGRLPSHPPSGGQWRVQRPVLTYRCGGSAGMAGGLTPGAPASRFTRQRVERAPDTCDH